MVRRRLLSLPEIDFEAVGRRTRWACRPGRRLLRRTGRRGTVALLAISLAVPASRAAAESPSLPEPSTGAITLVEPPPVTLAEPRMLSEPAIAALAAERAWVATVLDRQAAQLASQDRTRRHGAASSTGLTQAFLRGQAARQRGDAIAQALQGHYALRMLLEQSSLLESSVQTATAQQEQIQRAMELGLLPAGDESLWQIQSVLAELGDRRIQVQGRIDELRQQMAARLQAPWLCDYLPADSLAATLPPGDCAQWCRDALAGRADYRAWQRIIGGLDASSLPEAQRLVEQLIPAWTAGIPLTPSWLQHLPFRLASRRSGELGQLRSQMAQALQGYGNQICADVQTTAIQLETALQRAALAEEQIEPIQEQLERAVRLAEIGQEDAAEESRWELRRQQARLEYLARLGEAKQAEIEMRRLMGFWDR